MRKINLVKHRAKNVLHTVLLLGGMGALLGVMGWSLGGFVGLYFAIALGVVTLLMTPKVPSKILLRFRGARRIEVEHSPALHRILRRLAARAGMARIPQVYWLPSADLNAMAVGYGEDAAIGVTDGLLRHLDEQEMSGVLAHEIGHIVSGDTRVMGVADVMNRVTQLMSNLGKLLLFVNIPLFLFTEATIPWLLVLLLLAAPLVSTLLQLALSRTREFDADLNAVRLTGDPQGLARALRKLEHYNGSGLFSMFLARQRPAGTSILRTHPHTDSRIDRLRELSSDQRAIEDMGVRPVTNLQAVRQIDPLLRLLTRIDRRRDRGLPIA